MDDLFRMRDEYLSAHPEIVQAMKDVRWVEWAQRQLRGTRIIERRYAGGTLVSERDVTPHDPEPDR